MSSEAPVSTPSGFHQAIALDRLPDFRRLARDYAAGTSTLAPFFAGDPSRADDWRAAIARVRGRSPDTRGIADVLAAQLRARQAPAAALDAVERLRDPQSVAIVTGQQAGLFGGPLFTLLKALTAVRLAADIARRFEVACEAVFWVDAEDHDWDEVRGCSVLDGNLERRTISLPADTAPQNVPVGNRVLDQQITAALDALAGAMAETDFTAALLEQLREAWRPGSTMAAAFSRWLESILGTRGLIVFDASDAAAKPLVAEVFARELASAGRTAQLATEAGRRLTGLGYQAQVMPQPDGVALFRLDGGRHALRHDGEQLSWGTSSETADGLEADARAHPDRYSPNVLLRPIVQDTLFPTVAYIAGPSELAYLGQLKGVYEFFDVPMPLIYPRATATILDAGASRFLDRYGVAVETLQARDEQSLNRLLQAQLPASVERAFEEARHTLRERLAALGDAVTAVDPTLAGTAKSTLARMEKDLSTFQGKLIQAAKRRDETLRRQFARTQALLFPDGQLQERALGIVYFLNRYGPALIDRLEAELPLQTTDHILLSI